MRVAGRPLPGFGTGSPRIRRLAERAISIPDETLESLARAASDLGRQRDGLRRTLRHAKALIRGVHDPVDAVVPPHRDDNYELTRSLSGVKELLDVLGSIDDVTMEFHAR